MKSISLPAGNKVRFLHKACPQKDAATIVFVHGFPLDHSMWLGQLPLDQHASLLLLDLPGFGQSDLLPTGDVTMRSFADDVAEIVRQLQIPKVIFCGLSMGGYSRRR